MKYFASCSFGKDSLATVLLALEHGEPLDGVVYVEVMFDHQRGISGEIPEHVGWIRNTAVPRLAQAGVETHWLRSPKDYMWFFRTPIIRGKYKGKYPGFPIAGRCVLNRECKLIPMRGFFKEQGEAVQYVGIAADEPQRLERLSKKPGKVSLLAKYGYTEAMAYDLCKRHGLLSPIYETHSRNGCWFCPNMRISQAAYLRRVHPQLWAELEELEKTPGLCSYNFSYGLTLQHIARRADLYNIKREKQMTIEFDE